MTEPWKEHRHEIGREAENHIRRRTRPRIDKPRKAGKTKNERGQKPSLEGLQILGKRWDVRK